MQLSRFRAGARSAAMLFVAAVACAGCSADTAALEKSIDGLRAELAGVRAQNSALGERLDALEIKTGSLKGYAPPKPQDAPTGDPDRPDLQVVKLGPTSTAKEDPPDDNAPHTIIRTTSKGTVVEETTDGTSTGGSGDSGSADFAKAKELYDKKNYTEALASFTSYLVKYPDSPKIMDATYFAGAAAYQKGDYTNAVDLLTKVANASPTADKCPDALFDLGRAYEKLGDKEKAGQARKRLKADFPKSSAAKRLSS